MSDAKLIYKAQKPYGEDINDLIEKGGPGSGVKGHKTDYSWGTMRTLEPKNHSHSVPIHPEHWNEIKDVHGGKKESSSFKDETGKHWKVSKHPEGGVELHHKSVNGNFKHHLPDSQIKELDGPEKHDHDSFEHHRLMAGYHEGKSKKHGAVASDFNSSSDKDLHKEGAIHSELSSVHDKMSNSHLESAHRKHDPKVHGEWNNTVPEAKESEAYGEKNGASISGRTTNKFGQQDRSGK